MRIPFSDLSHENKALEQDLIESFRGIIATGHYVLGASVRCFEERFARYCGTKYAVGVNSGTDALFLSLKALGIGPGDEVITVPNSFIATISSVLACGATPVFVDVGSDYNMDIAQVAGTVSPRTKAILPVHLTGRPVDMDSVLEIAAQYNIAVIEDAAQAVGAEWDGQKVGSFGQAGCFSLHPFKILGALGDGGIITTNDATFAEQLRLLRNFGITKEGAVDSWGYNSRLDTLQAAFLMQKMDYLDEWICKRNEIAAFYRNSLDTVVTIPDDKSHIKAVYQTFVVQVQRREELMEFLKARGVETRIHYPVPLHLQPVVCRELGCKKGEFPVAEKLAQTILSLPCHPSLKKEQYGYVAQQIGEFYGKCIIC